MILSTVKKINAYVSLLTMAFFVAHTIYEVYTYINFIYNPTATKVLGYVLFGMIILHAILSLIIVFVSHDSKNIRYKKLNLRTYLQRISAFAILFLAPLHIFSFGILQGAETDAIYVLTEIGNMLFFAALFTHIAVSFSKSLISIGLLYDERIRKNIDRIMMIISPVICIVTLVIIVVTHNKMFNV